MHVFKFVTMCWNLPPVFQLQRDHTLRIHICCISIYITHNNTCFFFALYHMRRTSDDLLSAASCLLGRTYISYFLRDPFVTHSSYEYLPIYLQMSRARFSLFFNNERSFTRKIYPRKRNRFVCAIKK